MLCQACGEAHDPAARFCSHCGASLSPGSGPAIAAGWRPQVMSSLRGEERLVTVVFADLTESVRRTSAMSPEEATQLVNPLLEAMVELMVRHGGRIDRFLGDGVLAVFGVPAAHEDDPIRAVRAALELRERAHSLGLSVSAGVNTGRVYFGPVGSSLHEELTVMGPAVNLAARLQSAAGSDVVLVGEATETHIRNAFLLRPVRLTVKGLDDEVTGYRAERLVDHPDKVRGVQGLHTGLVGRDAELDVLRHSLDGPGETILVVGEAGLGKTRLVSELNRLVSHRGGTWLEGRCLEQTQHVPYAPFVDLMRRHLGVNGWESVDDACASLVAAGALEPGRVAEIASYLRALLGQASPGGPAAVDPASTEQRRLRTIDAVATYVMAASGPGPAVLLLEDMHWSDETTMAVVERLHRATTDHTLVRILTQRPTPGQGGPRLDDSAPVRELRLRELTPGESRLLISGLLAIEGLPPGWEDQVVAFAGGSPFFVEELLRSLIQRGVLTQTDGHWSVRGPLAELGVPESVEGLIMSRFDRLPAELKLAARVASVLDDTFTPELLRAMAGEFAESQLEPMVQAGLTRVERAKPRLEYSFVHALTRTAIYTGLLPSHRAELHELAATSLATLGSDDVDRLAHHYAASRNDLQAVEHMFLAGERSLDAYLHDAAARWFDSGLERVNRLPPADRRRWEGLYRARRGEVAARIADLDRAQDELHAALPMIDDAHEESRICKTLGYVLRLSVDSPDGFDRAHAFLDRAEAALDRLPERDTPEVHRQWIEIQKERALCLYFGGRGHELPALNARVGQVVELHGSAAQQCDHLRGVLLDQYVQGRYLLGDGAVAIARRALELARASLDPGRIAESHFGLGFTLLWADRSEEAAEVLGEAVDETARVGDVVNETRARAYHAIALRRSGRVDEAEASAWAALELAGTQGNSYYQGHAHGVLCWVGWRREDGTCLPAAERAYDSWGREVRGEHRGVGTEFAWLAVWPLVAEATARGAHHEVAAHLGAISVPWERRMPADLAAAVAQARVSPEGAALERCLRLARAHHLL